LNSNIHSTDSELLQRVSEYDSKALETLYNRYSSILYTLINKITADKNIAEDVLADVFAIVWRKVDLFDFKTNNVYSWLILLTRNKTVDTLRRMKDLASAPLYTEEYENEYILPKLSPSIDPLDLKSSLNIKESVEKALTGLTDAQQFVINLAFYDGLTEKEIAQKLNIPVSTVEGKIKIALSNLKNNLIKGDI